MTEYKFSDDSVVAIDSFKGERYGFLSNFYPARIMHGGRLYATSEHLFQAMKTHDDAWRERVRNAKTPAMAKRLGRQAPKRPEWDHVKDQVMYMVVMAKFEQNPELAQRLHATGQAELIEGNTWHDEYWGVDRQTNQGQNKLGRILMDVRSRLRLRRSTAGIGR